MAVSIDMIRVAADTGGGTQDITITDFGTAKLAFFFWGVPTVDNTVTANMRVGWGATDGSEDYSFAESSRDNQGTTGTRRTTNPVACISMYGTTGSNVGTAAWSAWITDGIRINWTQTPSAARLITVVLIGGTDFSVDVHNKTLGNENVTLDITEPGFEPDTTVLGTAGLAGSGSVSNSTLGILSCGFAKNDVGVTQRASLLRSTTAVGTSDLTATIPTDRALGQIGGSVPWTGEISDFDANGYSVTPRGNNSNDDIGGIAMAFNGVLSVYVGTLDTPTSTGAEVYTGFGLTPVFVLALPTTLAAEDTITTDGTAGTWAMAAWTADKQFCLAGADEDGQATTDTQTIVDDQALNVPEDDGSTGLVATLTSFDSDGLTLNYSAVLGTARKIPVLVFGTPAVAADFWYYDAQQQAVA